MFTPRILIVLSLLFAASLGSVCCSEQPVEQPAQQPVSIVAGNMTEVFELIRQETLPNEYVELIMLGDRDWRLEQNQPADNGWTLWLYAGNRDKFEIHCPMPPSLDDQHTVRRWHREYSRPNKEWTAEPVSLTSPRFGYTVAVTIGRVDEIRKENARQAQAVNRRLTPYLGEISEERVPLLEKSAGMDPVGISTTALLAQISSLQQDISKVMLDELTTWATAEGIDEKAKADRLQYLAAARIFHDRGQYTWWRETTAQGELLWIVQDTETRYSFHLYDQGSVDVMRFMLRQNGRFEPATPVSTFRTPHWTERHYPDLAAAASAAVDFIENTPR